jgi:peptidoglycan/xylan/chitin deacetylase (PgdA/CDA1 family)
LGERILTLCYHAIADLSGDPILSQYGIDQKTFAAQLDSLRARGFHFVTPDDLLALFSGAGTLPQRAVLLTFDDCYEELADVARSVLQPRGIEAIAFAVSGMASGTNEWDQRIGAGRLRLLDQKGLRVLAGLGVEIGCHSRSHTYLPTLTDHEVDEETRMAADDIEAMGLARPRFFAFPHGLHDKRSRAAVKSAGYTAAFGLGRRRTTSASDRFALPRVEILARDHGWRFLMKTRWPTLSAVLSPLPWYKRVASAAVGALRHFPTSESRAT